MAELAALPPLAVRFGTYFLAQGIPADQAEAHALYECEHVAANPALSQRSRELAEIDLGYLRMGDLEQEAYALREIYAREDIRLALSDWREIARILESAELLDRTLREASPDAPIPNKPDKSNWVEKAGGLPRYIRRIAEDVHAKGHDVGRSIAIAVGTVRNWCHGHGGNVSEKTRAKACAAVAEWEAKKAKSKAKTATEATAQARYLAGHAAHRRLVLAEGLLLTLDGTASGAATERALESAAALLGERPETVDEANEDLRDLAALERAVCEATNYFARLEEAPHKKPKLVPDAMKDEYRAHRAKGLSHEDALKACKKKVEEAALSAKARDSLPKGSFVFPKERRYPIHDISHARNALARSSGKPEEGTVKKAVYAKYPGLRKTQEAAAPSVVPNPYGEELELREAEEQGLHVGRGAEGDNVTHLQNRLSDLGFAPGAKDGRYGDLTAGAVKRFQSEHGLRQTGTVAKDTVDALRHPSKYKGGRAQPKPTKRQEARGKARESAKNKDPKTKASDKKSSDKREMEEFRAPWNEGLHRRQHGKFASKIGGLSAGKVGHLGHGIHVKAPYQKGQPYTVEYRHAGLAGKHESALAQDVQHAAQIAEHARKRKTLKGAPKTRVQEASFRELGRDAWHA